MIKYISIENGRFDIGVGMEFLQSQAIWIDMIDPTESEKFEVETRFGIELFTGQERTEIESSSKYIETIDEIGINLNFLITDDKNYYKDPVSFILKDNFLITQRLREYRSFSDTFNRIHTLKPQDGIDVFISLLENRIDFDADLIEGITDKISRISKGLLDDNNLNRERLLNITTLQESTIAIRENIIEKQRILSAILKSKLFPKDHIENLRIMIKDVGSLLDHTSFNFERLEFLQNTFIGLVDMEQNRVIKIFTVVTVIFMPPTLLASMYGMNFKFMPELSQIWGYPLAICMMIFSSVLTLWFFKRKRWI